MRMFFKTLSVFVLWATLVCCTLDNGLVIKRLDDHTYYYNYNKDGEDGMLCLINESDSVYTICHWRNDSLLDKWTEMNVFRFDCGDVTGDGNAEILVGTIGSTRYRPEADKRLFIFHLYNGKLIRPLWLGSRVGGPLKDFVVEHDSVPAMIHTWEFNPDSTVVQRIYRYKGFGLEFVKELTTK